MPVAERRTLDVDKFGRSYAALLKQQRIELDHWRRVLRPTVFQALCDYCDSVNGPCDRLPEGNRYRAGGLHSCPVGCELHHFVMDYRLPGEVNPVKPIDGSELL